AVSRRARSSEKTSLDRVLAMFPRLGERRRQAAGTLSGGEQQMLAIGRCLMAQPRLVMFDEPSLGLAPAIVEEGFRIVPRLNEEGLTILLVEQNVMASLRIAHRGYVLENGRIELSGGGAELLNNDRVRHAYLGLERLTAPRPASHSRCPVQAAAACGAGCPGTIWSSPTTAKTDPPWRVS